MNLQLARDWADLLLKSCSVLALLAGGSWAYYQFLLTGTAEFNLQLTVSAEVQPYDSAKRLLIIHAKPKNIGKVPVELPKTGFLVSLRQLPDGLAGGPVDLAKLAEIAKTDILQRFPDGYRLEPGVEYDEVFTVLVPPGHYAAHAVVNLDSRDEVDHTVLLWAP